MSRGFLIHWDMLRRPAPAQSALEIVTLDELVPKDHLLRRIDAAVDFTFIHDLTAPLYCADNGRPPLDPTLMFKALFLGYLFGIRSERQLVREIEVNVAYRWFLRLSLREGKPKGFFYLDHRTVDGRLGIITDSFATPANVHDSIPYLERLDRQRARFGLPVATVGLDAGYASAAIAHGLEARGIAGVTGYRNPTPPRPGMMRTSRFTYEAGTDTYRCPQGQSLTYATTDRTGYRHYRSDPKLCRACPLLASCTGNAKAERTLTRHVWQDARERVDAHRLTAWGKLIYARRKETVERSFADAKQLFGHRYARFRGLVRVQVQCLLAAAAQNIKKIAIATPPAKAKPA